MKRTSNSTRRNLFLVGLLAGLAWWGNPQTAYVLGPALVLHARHLWRARYLLWATLMGFAAGASPWLYAVSRDGLSPTGSEPSPPVADAVTSIFSNWLPVLLGLRPPFEVTAWTAWSASVIAVVLLTAMIAVIVRQRVPARLPTVGALLFLAGFTLSPFVRYTDSPRYALWVVPWLVLLVAIALTRLPRTAVPMALGGAAVLSAFGVHSLNQPLAATHYAPDVLAPTSTEGPSQLMRANGVTHAYADYWLAYRTTFADGDVELSPTYTVRNGRLNARVRNADVPAYVFLTQSDTLQQFLGYCQESAITCSVASDGPYTLVKPDRLITPSDASERVQWLRDMRATGV